MSDLIDTTEMYLRTVYELIEDGVTPMRARIAEQLGHSGPTVSQTVARMERDGLVTVGDDRQLALTPAGLEIATRVMRKHRLAERLLIDVIGLDLAHVHDEACRWEHVMSERVERRLLEVLDAPQESPYGNPIPGLDELGIASPRTLGESISVVDAVTSGPSSRVLQRIGENPQAAPGVIGALLEIGAVPGATVDLAHVDGRYAVATPAGSVSLDESTARHLFVASQATGH